MPDSLLLFFAVALLCGYAIVEARRITRRSPPRITGWWHYQHPDDGKRSWNADTWRDACEQSRAKSHERRGLDD